MVKRYPLLALVAVTFLLSGCSSPETPQEVAEAFWQAMLEGDAGGANTHSTLIDDAAFDGFEQDWQGVDIEWGRVVIDGRQASVDTTLLGLKDQSDPRETVTYLVQRDKRWLVDYFRTSDALDKEPLLGGMLGALEQFGQDLKARWSQQSDDMAKEIERLNRDLEQHAEQANERFSMLLQAYGEKLEQHLDSLSRSIEDALQDRPSAPPKDRRRLNQAVLRLDAQREALDEPSLQSVARSSREAAQIQLELSQLSDEFADYKAEWQQRVITMEKDLADILQRMRQPAS